MDVIHGYETIFPIPLGLSCTWDMKAIEESASIAAVSYTHLDVYKRQKWRLPISAVLLILT